MPPRIAPALRILLVLYEEIERYRQEAQAKLDSLTKELNEVNAQIAEEKDNG